MEIKLKVNKEDVYYEVGQTTAYTASECGEDGSERIGTGERDEDQLERFWQEARSAACQKLIGLVTTEGMIGDEYGMTLRVSSGFDMTLLGVMQVSLRSYFVSAIIGGWYGLTNKQEAAEYNTRAGLLLADVHEKALYKRKPTRPVY